MEISFVISVLYNIIVYTNNQWTPGDVLEDYDYTKVKEYLLMLHRQDYCASLSLI